MSTHLKWLEKEWKFLSVEASQIKGGVDERYQELCENDSFIKNCSLFPHPHGQNSYSKGHSGMNIVLIINALLYYIYHQLLNRLKSDDC